MVEKSLFFNNFEIWLFFITFFFFFCCIFSRNVNWCWIWLLTKYIHQFWRKKNLKELLFVKYITTLLQFLICCVRTVLFYCCETCKLTVADEARLYGVERRMIRMMWGWNCPHKKKTVFKSSKTKILLFLVILTKL